MDVAAQLQLRSGDVSWRMLDDHVVVLDLERSTYLVVEGAGQLMWQALVDGTDEQQLAGLLCESFDIDADTARVDVEVFVGRLGELGLLVSHDQQG